MFKKGMRKAIAVLVILTMIFTFVGCETKESNANQPQESITKYKAGTYTSSATGMNSDVKVEVTFSDDKIDSIKILEHKETAGIADAPIKAIPERIVANQSLSIDTVSGATMTSKAILTAVEDCVKQAGGNVDELMVKIENTTDNVEEVSYDIVVIGAGAAGSAAALAASENSKSVLLLEKTGSPMGAASLAGGMFAAESKLQKEAGKTVDKEWLYDKYMEASNGFMNSVLVRTIIEESSKTVDWLLDNNMELNLVDSGSGLSFANVGKPTTLHGYNEGGIVALSKLIKEFEANNGTVMFSTPATELLTYENGGVAGVIATKEDGSKIKINSKAVIIATGGFGGNKEMLKEVFKDKYTIGQVATNTGDGIIEMYNTYDHKSIFHSVAICLVKNYILLDTMTSAEIADLCNVSISTLNRFFKMMAYPMTVSRLPDLVSSTKENYTFDGSYIPLASQSSRECSIDYYINRLQSRIKILQDSINKEEINQLVKVISSSKKVVFLGKIPKAAWRFQMDLILRGIETSDFMDPNYQYEELDKLENETVIFYTQSHKFIDNKFKQGIISGKDKIKKFVLITNNDMHPLSSLADYLFYYEGDGTEQDNILMNIYINLIAIAYCKSSSTGLT